MLPSTTAQLIQWQHIFDSAQRASIFPSGQTLRFMQVSALLKDVFASHTSLDAQSAQAWNFEIDARKGNVMSTIIPYWENFSVVSHFEPRLLKLPRFTPKAQILRQCLYWGTRSQFSNWCCLPASLQCIGRKWRQDAGETSFQASDHVTSLCFIHFIRAFPPLLSSYPQKNENCLARKWPLGRIRATDLCENSPLLTWPDLGSRMCLEDSCSKESRQSSCHA